jgi:GT2 family glycosyltransferase
MNKSLSIVIPTFRRKESLQRLLQRLLAQRNVRAEIIVVDQNPEGYLNRSLPEDGSIRRLPLAEPNASTARNEGFLTSTGDIVLFIDDDLIPNEDFCANALEVLEKFPGIGCFSPLVYNAEGKELALTQASTKKIGALPDDPSIFSITDTISAAIFFRRDYFLKAGGFDPFLFEFARTAEDQEFFLRMQKKRLQLYFVPSVEIYHDESIPGGCELRTADYWISREKCMKAWAYRRRIHHHPPGTLSARDLFLLSRSGFLNKKVIGSGIGEMAREAKLLFKSIRSSDGFLRDKLGLYPPVEKIDHLTATKTASSFKN